MEKPAAGKPSQKLTAGNGYIAASCRNAVLERSVAQIRGNLPAPQQ
jgi:hypothetical protein